MFTNIYFDNILEQYIFKYLNIPVIKYENQYDKDILLTFYKSQKNKSLFNNIVLKYIKLKLY